MDSKREQTEAELAEQHHCIMALVDELETRRQRGGLIDRLERLHKALANHFALEQFPGGFYDAMGARGPEYYAELQDLVREHVTLLTAIGGLLERARMTGHAGDSELAENLAGFVAALRQHERKEHRLSERLLRGGENPAST